MLIDSSDIRNCDTFSVVPSIISEKVENALLDCQSYFVKQRRQSGQVCARQTIYHQHRQHWLQPSHSSTKLGGFQVPPNVISIGVLNRNAFRTNAIVSIATFLRTICMKIECHKNKCCQNNIHGANCVSVIRTVVIRINAIRANNVIKSAILLYSVRTFVVEQMSILKIPLEQKSFVQMSR